MSTLKNKRSMPLLTMLMFCFVICIALIFYLGHSMGDLLGQWKICAYTLNGIDPFALAISGEKPIDSIGTIPASFSTVPWACTLGNVFYPGFLPFEIAKIYITALQLVVCAVSVFIVYDKCKHYVENSTILFIALTFVNHFCFVYSWSLGNNGAIISLLVIDAICLVDRHPYIAGVLIAFAMVKPQITAIVCIVFLLNKKWKPILVGAVIDILGWIATCVITSTPFMTLFSECMTSGTSSGRHYYGVLSPLTSIGIDKTTVLLLNAVLGVAYTFILWRYLKKKGINATIATYVPACIASTIWTYKNGPDYMMVVLASVLFIYICLDNKVSVKDYTISFISIFALQMSRLGVNVMQTVFTSYSARTAVKSAEGILLMAIGVIFCIMWAKHKSGGESLAPNSSR